MPRYGLVASARTINEADERWVNGFTYQPEGCLAAEVFDPCATGQTKSDDRNALLVDYTPFNVIVGETCSAFGFEARDWRGRAERLLAAKESAAIERELWTGDQATASAWANRFLASPASDVVTAGATSPLLALECLEQALAQCGSGDQGMIHATPQVVTAWASLNVLRREGMKILTYLDTIVVAGSGYTGSDPNGSGPSAGSVWAYATGMVDLRRSSVQVLPATLAEAMDRSVNDVTYRAERVAAASWDGCCHVAAQIDLPVCGIGGAGS